MHWLKCVCYPAGGHCFNPLLPIAHKSARIGKISSILKLEGIIKKKISYERLNYESVDEKSLS